MKTVFGEWHCGDYFHMLSACLFRKGKSLWSERQIFELLLSLQPTSHLPFLNTYHHGFAFLATSSRHLTTLANMIGKLPRYSPNQREATISNDDFLYNPTLKICCGLSYSRITLTMMLPITSLPRWAPVWSLTCSKQIRRSKACEHACFSMLFYSCRQM